MGAGSEGSPNTVNVPFLFYFLLILLIYINYSWGYLKACSRRFTLYKKLKSRFSPSYLMVFDLNPFEPVTLCYELHPCNSPIGRHFVRSKFILKFSLQLKINRHSAPFSGFKLFHLSSTLANPLVLIQLWSRTRIYAKSCVIPVFPHSKK